MNTHDFCTQQNIRCVRTQQVPRNPHLADSERMDHYRVTLGVGTLGENYHELSVVFSKGFGHKGARPTCAEVFACLVQDATFFGDRPARARFDEWCGEYGYDTDSRRAMRAFEACQESAEKLRTFLGPALYATAINTDFED